MERRREEEGGERRSKEKGKGGEWRGEGRKGEGVRGDEEREKERSGRKEERGQGERRPENRDGYGRPGDAKGLGGRAVPGKNERLAGVFTYVALCSFLKSQAHVAGMQLHFPARSICIKAEAGVSPVVSSQYPLPPAYHSSPIHIQVDVVYLPVYQLKRDPLSSSTVQSISQYERDKMQGKYTEKQNVSCLILNGTMAHGDASCEDGSLGQLVNNADRSPNCKMKRMTIPSGKISAQPLADPEVRQRAISSFQ
ncbi:hypothetical protein N1851_019438 [Merluccius polli]|uniref:Uncharacterized protein n=1 Tax=Merluccius polli TaxID=89951 RepID=A0AA47MLL9_MERPO|nr:hypothetical protein N1851_019438 [Merluccius polli]